MNRLEVPEPLSLGGRMLEKVCSRMLNVGAGRYPQTSSVYILLTRAVRDDHPYRENAWEDSFQLVTNPVLSLYAGRKDWILVLLNSRHEAVLGFLITPPDAIAPAHSLGCSKAGGLGQPKCEEELKRLHVCLKSGVHLDEERGSVCRDAATPGSRGGDPGGDTVTLSGSPGGIRETWDVRYGGKLWTSLHISLSKNETVSG
nr:uncharacterized protein LOC116152749 isoform X1 [Camelus dromedarius]XP_031306495.1 uncharacterized protein LOC116152749 isoform X1 [Camelus dromedarius]XP_031306503.1 uncharacterized protein LOC116152749 isoform X1 [Camelus dromedarius]XP_031306513.1 uncharacterized protein LOC116152749 isoform X1 [Camelus dromedarius]XP_031306521.1 uncharacterized protein LOC116152749 isoform X1 [Camelus dromedarius]XP_031306526.1 uncharacterized protein LOC116152749 isoform X1 [Camelus dromedarius]XP_03